MSVFFDQTPAGTFTLTEDARAVGQRLKLHDSATNSHAMLSEKMTDNTCKGRASPRQSQVARTGSPSFVVLFNVWSAERF